VWGAVRGRWGGKILYLNLSIRNNFADEGWEIDIEGVKGRSDGG
jgi:hypothetical protein